MPQLHHCTPLSLLLLALLLHIAGSPVTHAIVLFFGFGSMVLVENPPLKPESAMAGCLSGIYQGSDLSLAMFWLALALAARAVL